MKKKAGRPKKDEKSIVEEKPKAEKVDKKIISLASKKRITIDDLIEDDDLDGYY